MIHAQKIDPNEILPVLKVNKKSKSNVRPKFIHCLMHLIKGQDEKFSACKFYNTAPF